MLPSSESARIRSGGSRTTDPPNCRGGCPYVFVKLSSGVVPVVVGSVFGGRRQWPADGAASSWIGGSGGFRQGCLVEGHVAEHGEEDVAAAPGEGDEGLVVAFALGAFPVVVGA